MKTVRNKSIGASLSGALGSLAEDVLNQVTNQVADRIAKDQDVSEYRENGWSTASSEVESSHRHIVQVRLKIPGAWWHPDNVPNILSLRMLKANGWWDEYWKSQRKQWAQRAQGFAAKHIRPNPPKSPSGQ
jgi:hypothetical protein